MSAGAKRERRLTGGHVLAMAVGAFGVIIAVNMALAWFAVTTFSGLAVDNSYVASQSFDRERLAQEALGWTLSLAHEDGALELAIADDLGHVVRPARIAVAVGRPTTTRADRTLELRETPQGWIAEAPLDPGVWTVRVDAVAADGTAYRRREPLYLAPPR